MTGEPDRPEPHVGRDSRTDAETAKEFARLRGLLLGREQQEIAELRQQLRDVALSAENIGQHLPEAVALRAGQDDQLARALAPTLESAFSEAVHRNPHQIAQAIYPTLGPAIRTAIAEAIGGLVSGINRALEESLSVRGLRWRIEAWRSGVPYTQVVMKHALVYRVEQAYLIHAETGLMLAHVTAPDLQAPDADVIAGMLTAIRDFVGDSFKSGGEGALHTFSVGQVTVLVEAGPRALLAAIVRGHFPPTLRQRLQQTLELLHFQFAGALARFDGDSVAFEAARPILAECLETVVDTKRRRFGGLVPRVAWLLVLSAVLAVTWIGVTAHYRWRAAVDALAQEPGIVVLSSGGGIRSSRVSGLQDPLARPALQVLAEHGVDTARVHGTWTPYLSAAPGIMRRRMQPTADAVVATHVLFATGSAVLDEGAQNALRGVAADLRAFEAGLGSEWRVQLEVVGRTDTTGSQELNRTLSDDRARVATEYLTRAGLRASAVAPKGIGTSDPLPAGSVEERTRLNRSVSFSVHVGRVVPGQERVP